LGACPNLKQLDLSGTCVDVWDALGHTLSSPSLSKLESLVLDGCSKIDDRGMRCLARALNASVKGTSGGDSTSATGTGLKKLSLRYLGIGEEGINALCAAIFRGALPHLEKLDLCGNTAIGDDGIVLLLAAIGSGRCPKLIMLCLKGTGVGPNASTALLEGLESDDWPILQHLLVDDYTLSAKFMSDLADVLLKGAGKHLTSLSLHSFTSSSSGYHRIAWVLGQGACPQLRKLSLVTVLPSNLASKCTQEIRVLLASRDIEVSLIRKHRDGYSRVSYT